MATEDTPEVPIYMEWLLHVISSNPFLLENLCTFARRVSLEEGGLEGGEVKISFPKKTPLGTLIRITWWNAEHCQVKELHIRWPDGAVVCPSCLGKGEFRFPSGKVVPCTLCYGEGVTGNVSLEPEMDNSDAEDEAQGPEPLA